MQKTALFLIQAKAGMPRIYRCLRDKPHVLLSYQQETADTTLYAPDTTWASGRNKLIEHVKANRLQYDYYVFLDEDVVFPRMTQKVGFEMFLSILSVIDHPIVTPTRDYFNRPRVWGAVPDVLAAVWTKGVENQSWELQTVDWFDGLFTAFSREAFFDERLLPYEEKFDLQSWSASQFITILRANHYYRNRIVQCNKVFVTSMQSSDYPRGLGPYPAALHHTLDELGVDAIEMSAGEEVKPDACHPNPPPFNLWYFVCRIAWRVRYLLHWFICREGWKWLIYHGGWRYAIKKLVKRPVKRLLNR